MVQLARLRMLRKRKALTQQELADRAGVTRSTVARVEAGEEPFPTTIRKLAGALGVEPEDLRAEEPDATTTNGPGTAARKETLAAIPDGLMIFDEDHVAVFLRERPELQALVAEAAHQLGRFIPDARLSLEVLADPDYEDDEQLFLGVSTGAHDSEATKALDRFDQEWWVHHARRGGGLLCVDLY